MITGVVLAAGRSRRMGAPKALLDAGGETFLAHAVRALLGGGCAGVIAVVGPDSDATADTARAAGAGILVNPNAEAQQIDSLRIAIQALLPGTEALIETPVDFPRIDANVVRALISAFSEQSAPVVVPTYEGKHGHPTLFARSVWPELLADPLPEGARTVVHAHRGDLLEVPVETAGILFDVDTPEDYSRIVGE